MSLKEKVISLIQLKQEGEYWDFKRQWHSKKNKFVTRYYLYGKQYF